MVWLYVVVIVIVVVVVVAVVVVVEIVFVILKVVVLVVVVVLSALAYVRSAQPWQAVLDTDRHADTASETRLRSPRFAREPFAAWHSSGGACEGLRKESGALSLGILEVQVPQEPTKDPTTSLNPSVMEDNSSV